MHASSGQENITCGEKARGPKEEKQRGRGKSEEERMKEITRGRGIEGAEQQRGIERKVKRECSTILGRKRRVI